MRSSHARVLGLLFRSVRYLAFALCGVVLAACNSSGGSGSGDRGTGGDTNSAGTTGASSGSASTAGSDDGSAGSSNAGGSGGAAGGAESAGSGGDANSTGNGGNSAGNGGDAGSANTPPSYVIGGTLSGLPSGQNVVLQDNGSDDLTLTKNGSFQFATPLVVGTAFTISVGTEPSGATCTVSDGTGASAPAITDVTVTCSTVVRTVGGSVSGLASSASVVLENNGADDLIVTQNGTFTFATSIASGSGYAVTVKTQPLGQLCTVTHDTGNANANVNDVSVSCVTQSYTIGGTLNGLGTGKNLVLRDNGGNDLTLTQNGTFAFSTPIASGANYAVSVFTQASGETCTVDDGNGAVVGANVTNVSITCSSNSYVIGGSLSGLPSSRTVVLQDNGGSNLSLQQNGTFSFATKVADSAGYTVTVSEQPFGMTCSVSNGVGTVDGADVTTVSVNCSLNAYTIGGSVSGLDAGKALVLQDNGGDDLTITANGNFTFATPVTSGSTYAVSVQNQPKGQSCSVGLASGTVSNASVTLVSVSCGDLPYSVGGTITGLAASSQVLMNINGSTGFGFTQNGPFTLPGSLSDGQSYDVEVTFQTFGQLCTIANNIGTINAANVTNLVVTCNPAFFLSVNVQTLAAGQTVVLQNNGGNNLTVKGLVTNGSSSFNAPVVDQTQYNVTVLTQPAGQTCTVKNGTGTINGKNTSGPVVLCSQLTVSIQAPAIASASRANAYVFQGSTLVAGWQSIGVDASGNGSALMSDANSTISSLTANGQFFAHAFLDGSYTVLVQVDKTGNGIQAGNADDWNYFGTVAISGPTTLTLTNANLKPYLNFGLTFSGQSALAGMNYFCAAHLPAGNIFSDFAQRTLFGDATGKVDGAGNASIVSAAIVQGAFDFSCLADNANASSGGTELQPYSMTSGKGVDSGFDYVATKNGVSVTTAGTMAISGFTPANFSTGTLACSGTYTSGGTGTPGAGSFNGNNNSSLMTGNSSCVAGTAMGTTHKTISVETPTGSGASHYNFGTAYLENRVGTSFSLVLPFTNTSGSAKAGIGISFSTVTFKDQNGASLGSPFLVKVAASTCVSGSSTISTCLGAGETGYIVMNGSGYPAVTSVAFPIADNSTVAGMNARIIPQSFTRYSDGELRVRVTNTGNGNGDLSTLSTSNNSVLVAFDQNGNPSDWTLFNEGFAEHIFAGNDIVGTSAPKNSLVFVLPSTDAPIDAASPQIKVFLSFGDTATAPN
ncbi:MAG TPA: DUF4369 domain-containing protein [Polyangiaceae bacterium]